MEEEPGCPSQAGLLRTTAGIVVVLADRDRLASVQSVLQRRFASDYEVVGGATSTDGLARISELVDAGRDVALMVAGRRLADTAGSDFLATAITLAPGASRGLLVDWVEAWSGDPEATSDLIRGSVLGQFDRLLFAPTIELDFFGGISELLDLWARRRRAGVGGALQLLLELNGLFSCVDSVLRYTLSLSMLSVSFRSPRILGWCRSCGMTPSRLTAVP